VPRAARLVSACVAAEPLPDAAADIERWSTEALQSVSDFVPALRVRALARRRAGRLDDALSDLRTALAVEGTEPAERAPVVVAAAELLLETGAAGAAEAAERLESLRAEAALDARGQRLLLRAWEVIARWADLADEALRRAARAAQVPPPASPAVWGELPPPADATARGLAGSALAEAATWLAQDGSEHALALLAVAESWAPASSQLPRARVAVLRQSGDPGELAEALRAYAQTVLDPGERDRLLGEAMNAERRARSRARAASRAESPPAPSPRPVAPAAPRVATAATASPAPRPARAASPAALDLAALDALVAAGRRAEALVELSGALRQSREPEVRRALLLRKGRWLLDDGVLGTEVTMSLTGALILDNGAAETRFELLRAYIAARDARSATEQWRAFLEAASRSAAWTRVADLAALARRLSALDRAPELDTLLELTDEVCPSLSTPLREAARSA
jgi:hypothetical protein